MAIIAVVSSLVTLAMLLALVTDLGVWYLILSVGWGIMVYLIGK